MNGNQERKYFSDDFFPILPRKKSTGSPEIDHVRMTMAEIKVANFASVEAVWGRFHIFVSQVVVLRMLHVLLRRT